VLLPRENESFTQLEKLEEKLTSRELSTWTAAMTRREVALRLPKFRDEERWSLKEVLETLGMKLAFTKDADFSKMAGSSEENRMAIDAVIHQAFIELDEKGTEAAAATAVGMIGTTALLPREDPIEFRADHPFIYCIMDDVTGTILFMGRMTNP
jgi:serpin B